MMFVDLLHTWITSERGGTEQTRKLSEDGGLGQPRRGKWTLRSGSGDRSRPGLRASSTPEHPTPSPNGRKPPEIAGGFLRPATTNQRFVKSVIVGLFAVTPELTSPRKAMV